ncbi:MAG: hypothetical protein ACRENS_04775 [Candidatus Eiseniibacteriota bacterium]
MSDVARARERALWLALVAVLATSMLWLATVATLVLVGFHAPALTQAFAVIHAIQRVALALAPRVLPLLSLAALGVMMLLLATRQRPVPNRRTRHV